MKVPLVWLVFIKYACHIPHSSLSLKPSVAPFYLPYPVEMPFSGFRGPLSSTLTPLFPPADQAQILPERESK